MSGFHELLSLRPSSLFWLFGCKSSFIDTLLRRLKWPDLVDSILVSRSWMTWSWVKLFSATADFSGCANRVCRYSNILISLERLVCHIYTLPRSRGVLYISGVLNPKITFNLAKKVEDILRWKSRTPDIFGPQSIEPFVGRLYRWLGAQLRVACVQIWGVFELGWEHGVSVGHCNRLV